MSDDYIFHTETPFYKHEISDNLSCDTYSMHVHTAYELIWFLDGDATHVIEDRKYKLKKGDLVLIRPFQYHFIQIDSPSRYERCNVLFDAEKHNVEGIDLISNKVEVISLAGSRIAEDIFLKCDFYHQSCPEDIFAKLLSHLLSELFYHIYLFPESPTNESLSLSPLISDALQYINENLCTIEDMDQIATKLFVSESYLFRLFKRDLHQTPKKYIMEKRLLLAQKMISSGEKPSDVCEKCGFSDYTTFYRNYTARFGHSPSKKHQR